MTSTSSITSAAQTAAANAASTSAITGTAASTSAGKTTAASQEVSSNFSEFLNLLTTQLQNQDPLSPMDSSQFTQQLVEYSQVEQQISTNSKLDSLTTLSQNQTLSLALGYVGKDITYTSSEMNFDGSAGVKVSYNMPATSAAPTAGIYDSQGNLVDTVNLDGSVGTHNFTWNGATTDGGTAPAGTYTLKVTALDEKNAAQTVSTAVTGHVSGIESQDSVPYLLVGARSIGLGSVIDTSVPSTAAPATTATTTTTATTPTPATTTA